MIYSTEATAAILDAILDINMSNNGYASFAENDEVRHGLESAGYVVVRSTDAHGRKCYTGYTKTAQAAIANESFGVALNTFKTFSEQKIDFEEAILTQNANHLFA